MIIRLKLSLVENLTLLFKTILYNEKIWRVTCGKVWVCLL